jgi:hypothetical protein
VYYVGVWAQSADNGTDRYDSINAVRSLPFGVEPPPGLAGSPLHVGPSLTTVGVKQGP